MCYIFFMKIRGVQFSPFLGNVNRNLASHAEAIEKAAAEKIDLIVFPELSLSGYQLKDIAWDIAFTLDSPEIKSFAEWSRRISIIFGAPMELERGLISNCSLCFSGGELLHLHQKTQLPNYGMFEEKMIFKPGNTFLPFHLHDFTVGILICREILFPVHAYLYHLQNTDLLIGISNSPFRGLGEENFSSFALWETMGYVNSVFFHQNYLFVNRTGWEDGIGFGGGSFYAPAGQGIQVKAPYIEDGLMDVEIHTGDVRRSRISANYRRDESPRIILKELERIIHERNE